MTQKDKELLLKDLSARQPYGVHCCVFNLNKTIKEDNDIIYGIVGNNIVTLKSDKNECYMYYQVKPYLRPMSSMTAEEICKIESIIGEGFSYKNGILTLNTEEVIRIPIYKMSNLLRFIYQRHLDFNNLIPKGLAIEVTKENTPYKE